MGVELTEPLRTSALAVHGRTRWWTTSSGLLVALAYGAMFWWTSFVLGAHSPTRWAWTALAVLTLVVSVRNFRRGVKADGRGITVRNLIRRYEIAWSDLSGIDFKQVDTPAISAVFYRLVFLRRDGSRVTADAPGGGKEPGETLFVLRDRLLDMQRAALSGTATPDASETTAVAARFPLARVAAFLAGVAAAAVVFAVIAVSRSGTQPEPATPLAALGTTSTAATTSSTPTRPATPTRPSATPSLKSTAPTPPLSKPKRVYWGDLRRGMCVREPSSNTGTSVNVVDCRAAHDYEVMSRERFRGVKKWTGDAAMDRAATKQCEPAFAKYVGTEFANSLYEIYPLYAEKPSWISGYRVLICTVYDPYSDRLDRSLRNARE